MISNIILDVNFDIIEEYETGINVEVTSEVFKRHPSMLVNSVVENIRGLAV